MKKEAPATTAKRLRKYITPRHRRLIVALLIGSLPRETADRVSGASNSPHYIRELRDKFHLNIYTERVERIDRDGNPTRPGVYHLEKESRELAELLITSAPPTWPDDDDIGA